MIELLRLKENTALMPFAVSGRIGQLADTAGKQRHCQIPKDLDVDPL